MNERKVYYIEDCYNIQKIKEGILIRIYNNEAGRKVVEIREPVDKYRPEHFHDNIPIYNVKEFVENDEIDFLNDMLDRFYDRLDDLWCNLKDVE